MPAAIVGKPRGALKVAEGGGGRLDAVGDVAEEAAGGAAVAGPVVEGQRQLGDLAHGELAVDHPRAIDDAAQAEDRDLRMVDDGGRPVHAEYAVVVHRERAV